MLKELFEGAYQSVCTKLHPLQDGQYWLLKVCIATTLVALFFSFPRLDAEQIAHKGHWQVVFAQAEHIFQPDVFEKFDPSSHESKMFYRVFVPVLVNVFHLNFVGVMCLQFLLSFLTFYLFSTLVYTQTQSKIITCFLTISSALILPIRLGFAESFAHFDIFALFFLVLACSYRNVFLIFMSIQFAGWTDERGLIATSLVFVFWFVKNNSLYSKQTIALISSIVVYFLLRLYIQFETGFSTPLGSSACVGLSALSHTIPHLATEWLRTLEGFWLIIFMMVFLMYQKKQWLELIGICFSTFIITVISVSVLDMVRSLAYLLPLILIAVISLKELITPKLSFLILVICFVIPTSSLVFNPSVIFTGNCFLYEMVKLMFN